ncbi:hypothetical protein [Thermococcus sp.]
MEEIDKLVWNFPLFKSYREKEKFFKVIGLLVSHQISFEKAAELLNMRIEELSFLLDKLGVEYSFLDKEEVEKEKDTVKWLLEELKREGCI